METKNKKGLITLIAVIVIILITGICIVAINAGKGKDKSGPGGFPGGYGAMGRGGNVTSVRTVIAEKKVLKDFVRTNGDIETQTSIEVFPSNSGEVVQLNVSLGSKVEKGEIIAYIDPSQPGSYYAKSPVTAPISGSVLKTPVKPGTKVSATSVITKIGDVENLQVSANIPERYVAELKLGQKAEITVAAYPDVKFMASVVRISPVVDSSTRTKEIILNFDKKDSRINAGMFAKVKLYTTEYSGAITIQQDALINNNDEYFLYVVNEDGETVTKRQVTLGKNVDGYYQILTGIEPGDKVVVEGMLTLAEGSKIKDITNGVAESQKQSENGNKPEGRPEGVKNERK